MAHGESAHDHLDNINFEFYHRWREPTRTWFSQTQEINHQEALRNRPTTSHYDHDKGDKYEVEWRDDQKFPHVAQRLGYPILREEPIERILGIERAPAHPGYQFQPFVQTPSMSPDPTLNFEQGEVIYESDSMVFQGYVSTDSNGGFASVRSPDDVLDLSGYDDLYIRMKSEGQPFSLVLSHTDVWYEGSYRYDITGASDEWQTFVFPLENFQLYEFNGGYPTATGEWMQPADRSEIFHLELMSKLFEDGDFRLEVDYIAFD